MRSKRRRRIGSTLLATALAVMSVAFGELVFSTAPALAKEPAFEKAPALEKAPAFEKAPVRASETASGAAAVNTQAPQRVVSLSLCMDEMLLSLLPTQRIAGVSRLARDREYAWHWQLAGRVPVHDALAEQILALQPDLVLAARYEVGKAAGLLRQLGVRVEVFDSPQSLADIPAHVRSLAALLQVPERGEQLLEQFAVDQQKAAQLVEGLPAPLAMHYAPNGYSAGSLSLINAMLRAAGYRTVADQQQRLADGVLSIEQMLLAAPDVLLVEGEQARADALASRQLMHPVLQRAAQLSGDRFADSSTGTSVATSAASSVVTLAVTPAGYPLPAVRRVPTHLWLCAGPHSATGIRWLAGQRRAMER